MLQSLQTVFATFFLNIHWKLSGSPLSSIYLKIVDLYERARETVVYTAWRTMRRRPHLNGDTAAQYLTAESRQRDRADTRPPAPIPGRLVAHVTFHLKKSRLPYLIETAELIRRLPFESVTIVLETNTAETTKLLDELRPGLFDRTCVHDSLSHPYLLTWTHREPMRQELDQFDYFLCIEDDIALTPESIRLWHERLPDLSRHNFLPGFLRVELNRTGELFSSDFAHRATPDDIVEIEGKRYLLSPFPYQAFWIYDKREMSQFINSATYVEGYSFLDVRASAAAGNMYAKDGDTFRPRHLLALTDSLEIDPRCFCFHMPSNYAKRILPHPALIGTLPVSGLIETRRTTVGGAAPAS